MDGRAVVRALYVPTTNSKYEPVSAEKKRLDGRNDSCVIVDELHEVDGGLYLVLQKGTSSRPQPLSFAIPTSGFTKDLSNFCSRTRPAVIMILRVLVTSA